jgi:hypothetical protein
MRALPLAVVALGLATAGCSSSGGHPAAGSTAGAAKTPAPCKLTRAQRRTVARALPDIRRLRRIQAPKRTFSEHGAPHQNEMTGTFMMDLGRKAPRRADGRA